MAEPSSPRNPFLGSQPTVNPEKPVISAPVNPSAPVSSGPISATPLLDVSELEGFIPTPASKWRHRIVRRGLIVLGLILIVAGGVYWWLQTAPETPVETESLVEGKEMRPTLTQPVTEIEPSTESNTNYESENFKAGEIVIGGELQFLMDESEVGSLVIENIRGEAFTEKSKQEVKLVVTWTTNKLAQATVRYSKGVGQTERGVEEADFSYNHSIIISGLDPASTYLYTIDAFDRYGNQVKSEPHAVFTGARTVSLFDLIAGAIGEVFGWAVTNK